MGKNLDSCTRWARNRSFLVFVFVLVGCRGFRCKKPLPSFSRHCFYLHISKLKWNKQTEERKQRMQAKLCQKTWKNFDTSLMGIFVALREIPVREREERVEGEGGENTIWWIRSNSAGWGRILYGWVNGLGSSEYPFGPRMLCFKIMKVKLSPFVISTGSNF